MKTKIFTIALPNGGKTLHVRTRKVLADTVYIETDDEKSEENSRKMFLTCQLCPYEKVCDHIKSPAYPNDPNQSLAAFCSDNIVLNGEDAEDVDEDGKEYDFVPVEGTWEKNVPELFEMSEIVKDNPLVRLKDVVESTCAKWCDSYKDDFSGCGSEDVCLLKKLFEK